MPTIIAVLAIILIIVLWMISAKQKLMVLDENTGNAMSQIGVQLSGRFDALTALLDLTKCYDGQESEKLLDTIRSERSMINAKSTTDDVLHQEGIISDILGRIAIVTKNYPEMNEDSEYIRTMDAVTAFDNMLHTSRLIYNDSVNKLNYEIRMFPVSLTAMIFGFRQKEYLMEQAGKTGMTAMNACQDSNTKYGGN